MQKLFKCAEKGKGERKKKRNCMEIIKKEKIKVAVGQGMGGQLFTSS